MAPAVSTVTLGSGLTLSCASTGSGPHTALLLPGPTDSWRSYEPVLEQVPSSMRTIAVSPRGHGDSDKPPTGYRVEDFAADVVHLLDALGAERAVLAGHSASCLVARRVAIDHPERVVGLLLEASPTTLRGDPDLTDFVESVVRDLREPIDPAFARSWVTDTSSDQLATEQIDQLVIELLKVPSHVWRAMFAALVDYDDMGEIGKIVAPTLLVWGGEDALVGRAVQEMLLERIPDSELIVYQGVGHTPRWEDPARFAADVAALVARAHLPSP
jgi:non-heme chloroperoxidase